MLTKDAFVKYINLMKKYSELTSKFCDVLEEMSPGCRCDAFLYSEYETAIVDLLKCALGLPQDNDDLEYFIYELEYGSKYKSGDYQLGDHTIVDFSSAENVYDYFVKYYIKESADKSS